MNRMKKYLFILAFVIYSGFAFSDSVIIVNSGFTFSPDDISINSGDIVDFQLESFHNAIEVSESTWMENGNTPLPGFSTPFGGGQVAELSSGVHYYVCSVHASGGMKGKITVIAPSGINDGAPGSMKFSLYPNPSNGQFTIQYNSPDSPDGSLSGNDLQASLEIYNILGDKIYEMPGFISLTSNEIDLSSIPDGNYFVRIYDRKKIYTQKMIKQ